MLLPLLPAGAETPPLTQPEMQQVLRTLQTQFADPDATGFTALNRAAIAGLLRDNPETMQLLTVPDAEPAVPPLRAESLTPRIACLRPHAFRQEDTAALREALTKITAGETSALILDLRAPAPDSDPLVAAELAGLFLPKDSLVFSLPGTADSGPGSPVRTTAAPVWSGDLLALTDNETSNTAEILAAILQSRKRALLIGGPTRGRTAAVAELPLSKTASGRLVLRFTAQRVAIPDREDPFGKGLTPDISAPQNAESKKAVFALQAHGGLSRGVFHPVRPRASEASLVARTNPELPDRIALTAGKPSAFDPQLTDRPLQLAVDMFIANQALKAP